MSFATAFKDSNGNYIEIFRNPSRKELREIESWKEHGSVRAILTENGDLICWDAKALHYEVQAKLHMKDDVALLVGDNYIYVTEKERGKFREAGELIERHKDHLASLIGEFEIAHYESDVDSKICDIAQPFANIRMPRAHWLTLIGKDREKILELAKIIDETQRPITKSTQS